MPEPLTEARDADPAPPRPADVVVVEDVWGEPFDHLAGRLLINRAPRAWQAPGRLQELLRGARAMVVRNRTQVTAELLERLPELQVVARAGVGLDNIDLDAADELGVVVVAALGANAESVAEHAVGAAIAVARRMAPLDRLARDGHWDRRPGRELASSIWGVLGLGATGRATAALARALRMPVVAHDPYVETAPAGVRLASLRETVSAADVLSVHLPSTPETRGLFDAELLSRMRPGAILVNVGRGDVMDEDALADAVESGQLAGAALDVRAEEPPTLGRLERLDNVLLTPHVAGITTQSQHRIAAVLADDIARVLSGEPARHAAGAAQRGRRSE